MNPFYDDLSIFVAVAKESSFRRAASMLNMPVSSVSRRISALEERFRLPLLRRTTRALSLTPEGETLYARARTTFDELDMVSEAIMGGTEALRGRLVVTAPPIVCTGEWIPFLLGFAECHSELVLDLRLTNAVPELVEEGIDIAFQLGPLTESSHVARKLWSVRSFVCASPALIGRHPGLMTIDHPSALKDFPSVTLAPGSSWTFEKDGRTLAISPSPTGASTNEIGLAAEAIKRGLGVGYVPEGVVHGHLGREFIALPMGGWTPPDRDLYAVYPAARQFNPKVRALIDYVLAGPSLPDAG